MKRKVFGTVCAALGILLVTASLAAIGYILWNEELSGLHAQQAMEQLLQQVPEETVPATPDSADTPVMRPESTQSPTDPAFRPMPEVMINGVPYSAIPSSSAACRTPA